jgi:hypothetical protein
MKHNAQSEWTRLDGLRRGFITRCEKYANFTLPRLCTVNGYDQNSAELSHDWQSIGAQATNHVVNKLVLALFAPSRPFFRLEADPMWKRGAISQGIKESVIDEALAKAERDAIREMDSKGTVRPKLYQALANLVVLGNVTVYLPRKKDEDMRVFGIKSYVARRTGEGKLKTLIIREALMFDELEPEVQDFCQAAGMRKSPETKVEFFRWVERTRDGKYRMSQWVDTTKLPKEYDGFWPEDKLPYRVLTWQLSDENDYGTGLVEDYAGDFAAVSALSEAQVKGAILASEFRWLVNPGGMTKPEDLESSENGAALPGLKDDVTLVANSKPGDLQVVQSITADYLRRIGQGFLMGSAVTRDAERVTAQEIRLQAQELETSFGGTYSRIAVDMQAPIADWLLLSVELDLSRTKLKRSIVTGLDALSRSGDLDSLRAALADVAQIGQLPPEQLAILNLDAINSTIFIGHGLSGTKFVKSEEQQAQEQQARQAQEQQAIAQQAGADAASQQIVQGQPAQ